MEMDFQLSCERPIGLQGKIIRLLGKMFEQCLAVELHHVAHLGRENIIRALGDSLTDQPDSQFKARLRQQAGAHLHHRGGKGPLGAHDVAFSPASSASSLPSRSSAYNSSQPPTCISPMKICGKVEPAPARSYICWRKLGSVATLNSV